MLAIVRGHESVVEGYKMHRWNGSIDFPMVITVFSAPNYCDVYENKGAIIKFANNSLNIQQYSGTKHPCQLPNGVDAFTWSIPLISAKVCLDPSDHTADRWSKCSSRSAGRASPRRSTLCPTPLRFLLGWRRVYYRLTVL